MTDRILVELSPQRKIVDALLGRLHGSGLSDPIDLSSVPAAAGYPVEDASLVPTREEVVANDRSRTGSIVWQDLAPLIPELTDADPLTVLAALQERFRLDPTEENSDLLQAGINQLTVSPELRQLYSDEVQDAKQVFHTGEGLEDQAIADNIWYEAYTDANFRGPEFFTSMTPNWAYWRQPDFRNVRAVYSAASAQDVISSVQFGSSESETGGQVVFFEHVRYGGRYRNFSVPRGGRRDVPWIGADFNDLASSALIIRRFPNELPPVSISRNVTVPPLSSFAGTIPGIVADGDPIFTWDMWPTGPTSGSEWHPNDVDKTFIHLTIPMRLQLRVKIGYSPSFAVDYRMQANYWIVPFVRNGRLTATVNYYGWHVEAGLFASQIGDQLKDSVGRSVPTVQNRLDAATARLAAVAPNVRFCYLLPGRNDERGHVRDDVTLVAVR